MQAQDYARKSLINLTTGLYLYVFWRLLYQCNFLI